MKCKRLLALALAAALCIVAAACGTKNNEPDTPTKTDTPTAAPGGTQTVGDTGDCTAPPFLSFERRYFRFVLARSKAGQCQENQEKETD